MAPKAVKNPVERPTKRAKTTKATSKPPTRTRGKKGRLSVLPTLPLDVLYEIFAHLGPADLISLARTSKDFRSVLLSRQCSFLWREVLDVSVGEGYPPRPEDMSEPAWAGFFFGGSFCSLCAAKTNLDVCWAQRRRFCKACAELFLVPVVLIARPDLMDPSTSWPSILSIVDRRPLDKEGLNQYDRNRKIPHAYVKDVDAYGMKLEELHEGCDGDNEQWEQRRGELDAELKLAAKNRWEHSRLCILWESTRTTERSQVLDDTRRNRGEEISKRLLALGFERQDVEDSCVREHKDFRDAKPLSERVWTRIQPGLIEVVKQVRAGRLAMDRRRRRNRRQEAVRIEYVEHVLRRVHHSVVPFMPPQDNIFELFSSVKTLIEPDVEVTDELRTSIREAILADLSGLQRFIDGRADGFRQGIPAKWNTLQDAVIAPAGTITTPDELGIAQFAHLDRAAYTARCGDHGLLSGRRENRIPIHFGLDALAHFCDRDYVYDPAGLHTAQVSGIVFDQDCHNTVVHICTLLGLDAGVARPLDLDVLERAFVCVNCPRASGGAAFMTWRDAVAHADPNRRQAHVSKRPIFRLASDTEKRYLKAYLGPVHRYRYQPDVWGCTRCTDHLATHNSRSEWGFFGGSRDKYMTLKDIRKHVGEKHNKSVVVEGEDIYFKRCSAHCRFVHQLYQGKRERRRSLSNADDIVLPAGVSDEALLALAVAKESENQQQVAANTLHINQMFGLGDGEESDSDDGPN